MQSPQVLSRVVATVFSSVKIRALEPDAVDATMALGRGGLGLDSIDILEIVVAVEHEFQVKVTGKDQGQLVFRSIGSIAEFVQAHSPLYAARPAAP